jgi:hypothetical protein
MHHDQVHFAETLDRGFELARELVQQDPRAELGSARVAPAGPAGSSEWLTLASIRGF